MRTSSFTAYSIRYFRCCCKHYLYQKKNKCPVTGCSLLRQTISSYSPLFLLEERLNILFKNNICEEIDVYYGTIKWNPCLGSYFQSFEVLVLNVHFQFGMNKQLQAFRPSSAFSYFLKILTFGVYCFVKVSTSLIRNFLF